MADSQPISALVSFFCSVRKSWGLFEKDESFTQGPQWEGGKKTKKYLHIRKKLDVNVVI